MPSSEVEEMICHYRRGRSFCKKITRGKSQLCQKKSKPGCITGGFVGVGGVLPDGVPIDRSKDPGSNSQASLLKNWRKRGLSDEAPWGIILKCPRYMHSAKQRVNLYTGLAVVGLNGSTMLTTFFWLK